MALLRSLGVKKEWQSAFLDFEEREDLSIVLIAIDDRLTVIAARDVKTTLDFNFAASGPWRADFIFRPRCVKQNRENSRLDALIVSSAIGEIHFVRLLISSTTDQAVVSERYSSLVLATVGRAVEAGDTELSWLWIMRGHTAQALTPPWANQRHEERITHFGKLPDIEAPLLEASGESSIFVIRPQSLPVQRLQRPLIQGCANRNRVSGVRPAHALRTKSRSTVIRGVTYPTTPSAPTIPKRTAPTSQRALGHESSAPLSVRFSSDTFT